MTPPPALDIVPAPNKNVQHRRFGRDTRGATAIEFAMLIVPFLALLFSIFENAYIMMVENGMEHSVATAARGVMTGQVQTTSIATGPQFVSQVMCAPGAARLVPEFIDCSKIVLDMRVLPDFSSANPASIFTSGTNKYCPGGPGNIVMVSALYPMVADFPIMNKIIGGGVTTSSVGMGTYKGQTGYLVVGTSVFQNEPFGTIPPTLPGC